MNEKKWKRFLKNEMDKEMQEIDSILEEMENNPDTKGLQAPDTMWEGLAAKIQSAQENEERLTDEEQELIRLGMVYKKRKKWNKVAVLVAAVICMLAIGVTSMGGPSKVIQKVQGMLESRERINTDTEDGRMQAIETISEVEAYQKIEDDFGFYPVSLDYLPEGIEFESITPADDAQNICMCYGGEKEENIVYTIFPNYRISSIGRDVEDILIDEYDKVIQGNAVNVKKYDTEETKTNRYMITFEYQNVCYILKIFDVADNEVEKIIENLYFFEK